MSVRADLSQKLRRALLRLLLLAAALASAGIVRQHPTHSYVVVPDPAERAAAALGARYLCGPLPRGQIPAHALVRRGDHVEVTSFDAGWRAYVTHDTRTIVLSFCAR